MLNTGEEFVSSPVFFWHPPLYRTAITGFLQAAREIQKFGTFDYLNNTLTSQELNEFLIS